MLNYLNAELWRMLKRRQYLALCMGFLALVFVAAFLWGTGTQTQALVVLEDFLVVGLYLCFPLASLTAGDLWRSGTLGNEISNGLPRARIYMGKFFASLIASVLLLVLALGLYLLLIWMLVEQSGPEELSLAWSGLEWGVFSALPRYIGALSLAHALCFVFRTSGMAPVLYYLYITVGELFLGAVRTEGLGLLGLVINLLAEVVRPALLTAGFLSYDTAPAIQSGLIQSWLVGLGWLAATTAVGLVVFSKREVK